MQYLLLIYEDESVYGPDKGGEAMNQVVAGHMAFGQAIGAKRLGGAGLQNTPTATTVRTGANGAKTLHDGPFAETKEQLGGCCQSNAYLSPVRQTPPNPGQDLSHDDIPLGQGGGASVSVFLPADEMALLAEMVVN